MALPAWMYKDPSDVLQSKQEARIRKSCDGCIHAFALGFKNGSVSNGCDKGKKFGRRCELYQAKVDD